MKTLKDIPDEHLQSLLEDFADAAVQNSWKGSKPPCEFIFIDKYVADVEDFLVTHILENYIKKSRITEHQMGS
jgi:hypothetical protein